MNEGSHRPRRMTIISPDLRGIMSDVNDTRRLRLAQKPVFVDWGGSRRRAVIAAGIAVGVALAGWLVLIVASIVVVVVTGPALPGNG
jgi:hypothetical protein